MSKALPSGRDCSMQAPCDTGTRAVTERGRFAFAAYLEAYLAGCPPQTRLLALMKAASDVIYHMSPDWTIMTGLYCGGELADNAEPDEDWLERYIPQTDHRLITSAVRECVRGKKILELEHRMIRKDGTPAWVYSRAVPVLDDDGEIEEWFGAARDITAHKRSEETLRKSEEQYRELVRHAPVGICELDLQNSRFVSVNDVMCELTGYSREELKRMGPYDLLEEEDKINYRSHMYIWLSGRKPKIAVDYKILTKDGHDLYISFVAGLIESKDGAPSRATIIAHDVTKRNKIEQALRKTQEKLRNADRNKNIFISMLSHELRNPLATIAAAISLLHISDGDSQIRRLKETIKRQNEHLCKLVDDLLDLTRIAENRIKLERGNIDLGKLILDTAKDMASAFEDKGIRFSVQIPEKPLLLYADPVRIKQSIENLLHNALKFTTGGGTVLLSLRLAANMAVITVQDEGMGISSEMLPHLFEPFAQADVSLEGQNNVGLGLGLSIANRIIEMHGGTLTAKSEGLGKGSLFTIHLPRTVRNKGA